MGRQRRKRQHKDKTTSKVKSTKRRTKDLDQIYSEIQAGKVTTPLDLDLPGSGQFICVHCARYFIDENSMKDHFKTKLHKKRYIDFLSHNNHHQLADKVTSELVMKNLSVEPYGGPEQDGQIKVDNGPKLNRNLEVKEEDNDQV
ncbi:zinc finger protein bud20, putative [Acanthamoeba castellanii str. Neff]|uniref:Zinc finger protein bud20, putative n=1 Tax=Acanthamoeba castellanii (strain ATCC 30010 / Neff) TaxID=1257118 RepID=L8H6R8_ACACF|nr:zinc finger protein bud20, putative [Acanthamoeba castellanii str. Neff]ELR21204.1 zinc finger protein bud20, putative [Acanthamoeba castellanii str. Neff]